MKERTNYRLMFPRLIFIKSEHTQHTKYIQFGLLQSFPNYMGSGLRN